MKPTTARWLEFANNDWEVAKVLFPSGKKLGSAYIAVVFHCHQCVEKTLKAVLTEQEKDVPKIHNLVRLATLTALAMPNDIKQTIANLNPHYMPPRYPDLAFQPSFSFTYNKRNTQKILTQTEKIIVWLQKKLT